jgi:cysteine desulfurase
LIYGGGQEMDMRSGTENVPGIVGLAKAFELAQTERVKESTRLFKLSDYAIKKIITEIPGVILNIPKLNRLPNNINLSFKGVEGEALMFYLDSYGICVSTSSACSTGTVDASHVLLSIGRSQKEAKSSIRLSLGKTTTKKEMDYLIKILPDIVKELRKVENIN